MKSRTCRTASVAALTGITLALGLVNAGSASASTPSGCGSVRQIGSTKYIKYKGQSAASVKQYYGCGKNYAYLLIWDSFRKHHKWKTATVGVMTPEGRLHAVKWKDSPAYEMWSAGYATTNCTQAFGLVQVGSGADKADAKSSMVC
ncbi:hypothetical protein [Streptomyces sp. bgisy100]|uniref:hypothetical protein n=1 Tax=Streptomyces sp. bgisy100 TaxID=3413783 RepID=UPI003D7162D3